MPRCRLDFDPDEHDPDTAGLAETVRRLLQAQQHGHLLECVRLAGALNRAADQVAARTLIAADAAHGGPASRQALAEAYGQGGHEAITRRLTAVHEAAPATSTDTVAGCRVRVGDIITDPSGAYAQYGPITEVGRAGPHWIATTESGQQLTFLSFDLVTVDRRQDPPPPS